VDRPPSGRLPDVGSWLTDTTRSLVGRFGELFAVLVVVALPVTAISAPLLWSGLQNLVLIRDDQGLFTDVSGMTGADGVKIGVALLVAVVGHLVVFSAATHHVDLVRREEPVSWRESLSEGLKHLPRTGGVLLMIIGLTLVANVITAVVGSLASALGLLLAVALLVFYFVLWVRGALAFTHAALGREGSSLQASFRQTKGFTWPLFGRLILLSTIVVAVQVVSLIVAAPFQWASGDSSPTLDGNVLVADLLGSNPASFLASQLVSGLAGSIGVALWAAAMLVLIRSVDNSD